MDSTDLVSQLQGAKRKRSPSDTLPARPVGIPTPPNNGTQINYLAKPRTERLTLVDGSPETFGDTLGLIDDYEGVLLRNESLAANLGAKLVGPLLLKSFDKLFDGPITILQAPYGNDGPSVTWLDVVEFARTKPQEFLLNSNRVCQFWFKQCHVQISEDDCRLIHSGAPERMIPSQPIPEDEISELGTIEILEQRLALLIKKADLVAGRARQLNYHLKGRKAAISKIRSKSQLPDVPGTAQGAAASFQPINHPSQSSGEVRGLHVDLLRQFMVDEKIQGPSLVRAKPNRQSSDSPHTNTQYQLSTQDAGRRQSHPLNSSHDDGSGGPLRPIMTARVEKLNRGESIWPPCDRCRRLSISCTKHLTACSGCTKKHARCGWKDVSAEEAVYLQQMPDSTGIAANEAGASSLQITPHTGQEGGREGGTRELGVVPGHNTLSYGVPQEEHNEGAPSEPRPRNEGRMSASEESMLSQMASAAAAASDVRIAH